MKIVDISKLPADFPTHRHSREFWENLGRTVATYGSLEEMLLRAILAFEGGIVPNVSGELDEQLRQFGEKILKTASQPLNRLKESYEKAAYKHYKESEKNVIEGIIKELDDVQVLRNVLCHASWAAPDQNGFSKPFFVRSNPSEKGQLEGFDTPVNCEFLKQIQKSVSELSCDIANSVTRKGFDFP